MGRKILFVVLCLVFVVGCVGPQVEQRIKGLESNVEELRNEMLMQAASEVGAATKRYGRTLLTGTVGQPSVDNILESGLQDGDLCIVRTSDNYNYEYRWDATNNNTTNPESLPNVIVPNTSDGIGAWILQSRVYSQAFYSAAQDGEHYVDPSNTGSLPVTPPQGALSVRDDYNAMYIADSSNVWWPLSGPTANYTTNQNPLAYILHRRGFITNYGATNYTQHTLRKAVLGMDLTFHVTTNNQPIRVDPNAADKFIGTGFTDGEYYWADGAGEYLHIRAATNGAGGTDVDWAIVDYRGTWAQESPP